MSTVDHKNPGSQDLAPQYEDLFAEPSSKPITGYARVSQNDDHGDVEGQAHEHDGSPGAIKLDTSIVGRGDGLAPHIHCEVCDRRLDRRERRRSQAHCCRAVSATFVLLALFLMIFGIVAMVVTHKRRY
ncbi:uncharacterized protein N7482_010651 [Penicillium canariense]|uniref:Uncharacterized protein n=1 Tax=Penicillium canariense TaxID=189055 RepID=A0A9W9HLZ5_9EURO|nr:uncharacterized protein N7482_010651 [Penicillium canariense]KAJ5151399.1 hypothetical protein N7482_010651 [Penicillium canariense]